MARLRRDRLTNRIGVNIGPRVDGSGINRGIKSEFPFCMFGWPWRVRFACLFLKRKREKLFVLEGFTFPPWPNLGPYSLYDYVGWVSLVGPAMVTLEIVGLIPSSDRLWPLLKKYILNTLCFCVCFSRASAFFGFCFEP